MTNSISSLKAPSSSSRSLSSSVSLSSHLFSSSSLHNIIESPQELYEMITEFFPEATVEVEKNFDLTDSIKLKFTIPNFLGELIIESSQDRVKFREYLEQLKFIGTAVVLTATSSFWVPATPQLSKMASKPLCGSAEFFRFLYKAKGHSLFEPITKYLTKDDEKKDECLANLGLAPSQVDKESVKKEDLELFFSWYEALPAKALDSQKLNERFGAKYPYIKNEIIKRKHEAQKAKARSGRESKFVEVKTKLEEQVIGQSKAVEKVIGTVIEQLRQKQNASFLFVGPTGTGKTELAKALAKITKKGRFIRFNMNEYMSDSSFNKLFGLGPGYVGSESKPDIAQEFDICKPKESKDDTGERILLVEDAVVLFDEFEKAHFNVRKSLLTLLDEGTFKVSYANPVRQSCATIVEKYRLNKCIIIGTSNLFQREILALFQQEADSEEIAEKFKKLNSCSFSEDALPPELFARMEVTPFGPIEKGINGYQKVLKRDLDSALTKKQSVFPSASIAIDEQQKEKILSHLEEELYGDGVDLRKIARFIDSLWLVIYKTGILDDLDDNSGSLIKLKLRLSYNQKSGLIWRVFQLVDEVREDYYELDPIPIKEALEHSDSKSS